MLENSTHLPPTLYNTIVILQCIHFIAYYLFELIYYEL